MHSGSNETSAEVDALRNKRIYLKEDITFTRRVVRLAAAKELFSSPLVGKWPLSASTRSQAHCGISIIKQGLTKPGSEIKTGSVMAR